MRRLLRVALINLAVLLAMYGLTEAALHVVSGSENPLFGRKLRIPDPAFHHTLRADFSGTDTWGDQTYPVFTDSLGFKDAAPRTVPLREDRRRVLFIGDSFTEGIGLPYEQTFVGLFARAHPELDVLNAGVVSYAPSAYYEKIRALLERGLIFDEAFVYIDISDIRDEAVGYCYDARGTLQMRDLRLCEIAACPSGEDETVWWKQRLKATLYIPDFIHQSLKRRHAAAPTPLESLTIPDNEEDAIRPGAVYGRDSDPRASWTYERQTKCFGALGIEGGIAKAKERMDRLHEMLAARGIPLSVGIYPWPQQLLYDDEDSLQVRLWRAWCEGKCARFLDQFPVFFRYKRDHPHFLRELYVWGDVHYTALGNRILADDLLAQLGSRPIHAVDSSRRQR
jgi:hypothetical protein